MGLEVVVEGKKHIPDTPCVLVANHQSAFDLVAMCAVRPARCALVAKQQARFHLTIGVVAMLIGTVFVDKHHTKRAIATMDKAVDAIRRDKISLFLYPEGSRNPDGGLLPFKKGAFHVAIQAQVPVVPVVITGYKTFYSAREKRFESGTLTVTCLPQISTRNLTTKHVDELSHRVRQQMLTVFNKRN
nr:hypothetical protein BaRGS_005690 [Batillaria attramentaria]